jgi:hypothetical protein
MLRICEGRATGMAISDPLLDDLTLLISAALMAFNAIPCPKVGAICGEAFDGDDERDSLKVGGGA